MQIEDPNAAEQVENFRRRLGERLAEHGRLAGLDEGEAFKLIDRV
jgi:hypothetical protein